MFSWIYTGDDTLAPKDSCRYKGIICLATDDILLIAENKILFSRLKLEFDSCFKFTTQDGPIIRFLNFRIIQSHHGISIDQTEHTLQNILDDYWRDKDTSKLSWLSSPFPTISSFEIKLFDAIPLLPGEHTSLVKFHNGSLEKWVGALMNIRVGVRLDISYAVMRLSTYMSQRTVDEEPHVQAR